MTQETINEQIATLQTTRQTIEAVLAMGADAAVENLNQISIDDFAAINGTPQMLQAVIGLRASLVALTGQLRRLSHLHMDLIDRHVAELQSVHAKN